MPAASNRLNGDFSAQAPNQAWVADITFVCTREGWLYLAIVLDLFSLLPQDRRSRQRLEPAPGARPRGARSGPDHAPTQPGLIHHGDRGGQYLSAKYQDRLDCYGIICSMSRPGRCADNAAAESFFHTLKTE